MSPFRCTCKSRAKLAAALATAGWHASSTTVGRLLHELGYRLQSVRKSREGTSHPDRNGQFEHINTTAAAFPQQEQPVISVDTGKKEPVGKAIPYGVRDMARNEAWVGVGRDHDTPAFAVASIRRWWTMMGRRADPQAKALLITADAGGSNRCRSRGWKKEPQRWADDLRLRIRVSHSPPGTSKWNKIGHRLICHCHISEMA